MKTKTQRCERCVVYAILAVLGTALCFVAKTTFVLVCDVLIVIFSLTLLALYSYDP